MPSDTKTLLVEWEPDYGVDQIPIEFLLSPKATLESHKVLCRGKEYRANCKIIKIPSGVELVYDKAMNKNNDIILGRLRIEGVTAQIPKIIFIDEDGTKSKPKYISWKDDNTSLRSSLGKTKGHGNPDWSREEIILALELYQDSRPKIPSKTSGSVKELSKLLNSLPFHELFNRKQTFRNPDGVAFKLQNIHSAATGMGLSNISNMDRKIWKELGDKPKLVKQLAEAIKNTGKELLQTEDRDALDDIDDFGTAEGRILGKMHRIRERSRGLRIKFLAIEKKSGPLTCPSCSYTPSDQLGDAGDSAFEVHHILPLHQSGPRITQLKHLVLLCARCHRLIHRLSKENDKWLSVLELKEALL
jgi:5-methylcytosine-specific restriction enzyme A